jgi:3-oxoacyl-[acyl-carrier protein] reductase
MQCDLNDKTVLVTGAGKGIGRAIALACAQAGARVAINDRDMPGDLQALLGECKETAREAIFCKADVSQQDEVVDMVEQIIDELGSIDVLVNNAGISRPKPFLELSEDDWDQTLDINLKSVFLCSQQVLPHMLEKGEGCIINIASELGYLGRAGFAPYTASKGGIITLTRSMAREFAPTIRINAIAPGPCDTEMLRSEIRTPEQMEQELDLPMGRFSTPEEIAGAAVFLASEHASYFCGDVLSPNGGSLMR